jgi:hypothetical protein
MLNNDLELCLPDVRGPPNHPSTPMRWDARPTRLPAQHKEAYGARRGGDCQIYIRLGSTWNLRPSSTNPLILRRHRGSTAPTASHPPHHALSPTTEHRPQRTQDRDCSSALRARAMPLSPSHHAEAVVACTSQPRPELIAPRRKVFTA